MNKEEHFNAKEIAIQKNFKFTIDDFALYNTRDLMHMMVVLGRVCRNERKAHDVITQKYMDAHISLRRATIVMEERIHVKTSYSYHLTEKEKRRFFAINPNNPDYVEAHTFSIHHREMLEKDNKCGCFNCLNIFHPSEIKEWLVGDIGHTALCPYCGIDSVIGESSGYPITKEFLKKMQDKWF